MVSFLQCYVRWIFSCCYVVMDGGNKIGKTYNLALNLKEVTKTFPISQEVKDENRTEEVDGGKGMGT